jgi:hypothetical protein
MTVAEEAQRYLAVVEIFRAEGCEPQWRPETSSERPEVTTSFDRPATNVPQRRKT